jgi:uncharacterized protein (TIGR02246 family)
MNAASRFAALVVLSLFLLSSCANPPAPAFDLDGAKKGIAEANAKWIDGMKRGDAEAVSQLYMEDAILLPPNAAMAKGRKAIKDDFETMMKSWVKLTDMTLVTLEINGSGDFAYEVGNYAMTFEIPGGNPPVSDTGKYLAIWKKQADNTWKYHVDSWSSSQPAHQ